MFSDIITRDSKSGETLICRYRDISVDNRNYRNILKSLKKLLKKNDLVLKFCTLFNATKKHACIRDIQHNKTRNLKKEIKLTKRENKIILSFKRHFGADNDIKKIRNIASNSARVHEYDLMDAVFCNPEKKVYIYKFFGGNKLKGNYSCKAEESVKFTERIINYIPYNYNNKKRKCLKPGIKFRLTLFNVCLLLF